MSLKDQPENTNFLQPSSHRFAISRLPTTSFMVQSFKVPDIYLEPIESPSPMIGLNHPGDHLKFTDLVIEFKVDEDLKNYLEILTWMKGLGYPKSFEEYRSIVKDNPGNAGIRSDASLVVLDSADVANREYYFYDIFPIRMTGPEFDTRNLSTGFNYLTTYVAFSIRDFDVNVIIP
jgi:hypothetical protein